MLAGMGTPGISGRRSALSGSLWRSRWAAVGAAVAVTLGAGSMVAVDAVSSEPSSFVSVSPTRILDTRTDVGLAGPFVSGVAQKLQVTGTVPTQPPGGAAAVDPAGGAVDGDVGGVQRDGGATGDEGVLVDSSG